MINKSSRLIRISTFQDHYTYIGQIACHRCYDAMLKFVGIALLFSLFGCAKLMEDQPGAADSIQSTMDTTAIQNAAAKPASKVPERFLTTYNKEFTGTVGVTGGATHSIDVEMVMDVLIELRSEAD